jgi:hypothetical protein
MGSNFAERPDGAVFGSEAFRRTWCVTESVDLTRMLTRSAGTDSERARRPGSHGRRHHSSRAPVTNEDAFVGTGRFWAAVARSGRAERGRSRTTYPTGRQSRTSYRRPDRPVARPRATRRFVRPVHTDDWYGKRGKPRAADPGVVGSETAERGRRGSEGAMACRSAPPGGALTAASTCSPSMATK